VEVRVTKPIYRLSLATIPDSPEGHDFIGEATAKLEAAGYVVVLTTGPNEIHAPPVDNTRALMAASILGGVLAATRSYNAVESTTAVRGAVVFTDQLLKELAK
jgi:hypothetical protein